MYCLEVSKVVRPSFSPRKMLWEGVGRCRNQSLSWSSEYQAYLEVVHAIIRTMCEFVDDSRVLIEPAFDIGVSKGNDIFSCHWNLFNCLWSDYIMSQSIQKVQPPRDDHVVRVDEVFLREGYELLGVIYLSCVSVSVH